MTDDKKTPTWAHAIADGLTIPQPAPIDPRHPRGSAAALPGKSRVLARGDQFELTPEFLELTKDGYGETSWPEIVSDPAEQVRRWHKVMLAPGKTPLEMLEEIEAARLSKARAEALEQSRYLARFGKRVHTVYVPAAQTAQEG